MQQNKLCTGISILYEMEQNNYLMTRAVSQIDQKASQLGHSRQFKKPPFPNVETYFLNILTVTAIVCAVVGVILGIIESISFDDGGIIYRFFISVLGTLIFAAIGAVIGFFITVVICSIIYIVNHKKAKEEYQWELKFYNNKVEFDQIRVRDELTQKNRLLKEKELLVLRLYESKTRLDNFYNIMSIDREFRSLIAIGYMDKFIKLGISTKLTGADGLYYLIMQELDKELIKLSLLEISAKLDTLIDNQNRLYGEIHHINDKCDQIIKSTLNQIKRLDSIEKNTELANYSIERAEKELEFQNFMILYNS